MRREALRARLLAINYVIRAANGKGESLFAGQEDQNAIKEQAKYHEFCIHIQLNYRSKCKVATEVKK